MTWTEPFTAVENTFLTAAQFNVFVRDNLLETEPARATADNIGQTWFSDGPNKVVNREINDHIIETSETTLSTDYVDLATHGPKITLTARRFLIFTNCQIGNSSTNSSAASYGIYEANTSSTSETESGFSSGPIDSRALIQDGGSGTDNRWGACQLFALPNLMQATVWMKYRVSGSTGTFQKRRLQLMAL